MLVENNRFVRPSYVNEGDVVVAPWRERNVGIRCVVACAAGQHARVMNARHHFNRWFHINDLRIDQEK